MCGPGLFCCGVGAVTSANKKTGQVMTKVMYSSIIFLSIFVGLVLNYWGGYVLKYMPGPLKECDGDFDCLGEQVIYRISISLAVFFLFMMILTVFKSTFGEVVHHGLWPIKYIVLVLLFGVTFAIPNFLINIYAEVCRYVSLVFLLLQILILIDFAYTWNEKWVSYDSKPWYAAILVCAFGLFFLAFVGIVLLYVFFCYGHCSLNIIFITITVFVILGFSVLSCTPMVEHGAVLPSAVVAFTSVYYLYTALASMPWSCNPMATTTETGSLEVAGSLIIAGISIAYASTSAASSADDLATDNNDESTADKRRKLLNDMYSDKETDEKKDEEAANDDETDNLGAHERGETSGAASDEEGDGEKEKVYTHSYGVFHLVMLSASMYIAMVLTNWGDTAWSSFWVKLVSQWLVMGVYIWTLIVPLIFPNRDFGRSTS